MSDVKKGLDEMMPREIVAALDKYIIGQDDAKKLIAVAIRNRVRRKALPEEFREEITPKNIIMIGPTGVGKTEIARRIAKLANAPFIKVEATKFTEVGYVGRDVESMVKDLMAASYTLVKEEMYSMKSADVEDKVNERLLDLLLPALDEEKKDTDVQMVETRNKFRELLQKGMFEDKEVDMVVKPQGLRLTGFGVFPGGGAPSSPDDINSMVSEINSMFSGGPKQKMKKVTIKHAREIIREEELDRILDDDKVIEEARFRCQNMGIIFIDEIDKIASKGSNNNTDVSREGVQRDILPIVEGTKVSTKWGVVDTTNILFIAAGAFSVSKPSDLIPELQGRFPLRVELKDLTADDFYRILTEPSNAIIKQYKALLATEGVDLEFDDSAIRKISVIAEKANQSADNIGARRLHTVMEKLLEDLSFDADLKKGEKVVIDDAYVEKMLGSIIVNQDLTRYIL